MVNRKLVLAIVVFAAMFVAVAFDPLNLKGRQATKAISGQVSATTGLISGSGVYESVLSGVLFLILVSLFYFMSKKDNQN